MVCGVVIPVSTAVWFCYHVRESSGRVPVKAGVLTQSGDGAFLCEELLIRRFLLPGRSTGVYLYLLVSVTSAPGCLA